MTVGASGNVSSDTDGSQSSYSLAYTMNALTLSAVDDDNKSNAYTASYVYCDDVTVYSTNDTTKGAKAVITTGVTLAVAGATVDLSGDQNSNWDASVS